MIESERFWPAAAEGLALALALVLSVVLVVRATRSQGPIGRAPRLRAGIPLFLPALVLAGAATWVSARFLVPKGDLPTNRPVEIAREGYESSDACRSCHPDQYHSWHASYHRTMTQVPSRATVVADFEEVTTDAFARRYRLYWKGDELWVEMDDPTWREVLLPAPRVDLPIVLSTGSHHMQVFWYGTLNGPLVGLLPVAYEIHDERWMPVETNFIHPPNELGERRLLEVGQWNQRCIACHTTRPVPALVGSPHEWGTRATELGIACEACHGPGEAHVAANRNPIRRYLKHLSGAPDETIVNPARLPHDRASEVCGRCHSVWNTPSDEEMQTFRREGDRYVPGAVLAASGISVARGRETNPDAFWPDGGVRPQGREYTAMIRSGCFTKGEIRCTSCHTMHLPSDDPRPITEWTTDQLGEGMRGDAACLQCHEKYAADIPAHTHHPVDSSGSRCMNCHMPNTVTGVRKASRNHEILSPSVANELASGRPNACNLCHLDQTLAWTDEHLTRWYGTPAHTLEPVHERVPDVLVHLLRGDAARRAIAAWNLSWPEARETSGSDAWAAPFLGQLLVDPYHAVRYMAHRSLRQFPGFEDLAYDYVGSEDHRWRTSQRVTEMWAEHRASRGEPSSLDFLLAPPRGGGASGSARAVFASLLAERDDTPIRINE